MGAYVVKRLLWTPILLLIVALVTFILGVYGPGDPVEILQGQYNNPEVVERIREQRGLNHNVFIQFGTYVKNVVQGDLGESFKYQDRTVTELIGKRIWVSAQLGLAATIISLSLGIPLGVFAAMKQGTWIDVTTVSITLVFMSLPVFITAPVLLIVFGLQLGILPVQGWGGFFDPHMVMPAMVMGVPGVAIITRLTRASTLDVLSQDYVRTARAKGLGELLVRRRHILRNALIPVFTVVGLSLATLVEGSFITEGFFGIPGIGSLAIEAFFSRDYPIITALVLIIASAFVVANLIVDIGYRFLDPRIRY
jgi:ABC-type dipeptide/oligopeptide/nickel transport system permease component